MDRNRESPEWSCPGLGVDHRAAIGQPNDCDGIGQWPAGRAADAETGCHQAILAVLDGAKAISAAVKEVFDRPAIGRCQIHKLRNARDHLPQKMRGPVGKRMREAYHADSALQAETLTVLRLDVPPTLARTLRSTNAIESMISISPDHARDVKRWRDAQMALRRCAAGMVEASKQFRRVNGHLHLPVLQAVLEQHVGAETFGADCNTQVVSAA